MLIRLLTTAALLAVPTMAQQPSPDIQGMQAALFDQVNALVNAHRQTAILQAQVAELQKQLAEAKKEPPKP